MFTWFTFIITAWAVALANAIGDNTTALPVRIMPVGASVTFGVGSSTGNSYRKALRDMLVQAGHQVNMVGQHKNGNFSDNDVEATSGYVIAQIANSVHTATPIFLPNLVLLDAGTNNCNSGRTVSDAGANVTRMIDDIFKLSPGVTVLLATILKNKNAEQDACRVDVNKQYSVLATRYEQAKSKFLLVDMRSDDGPTTADLFDSRHPNDVGYGKMAVVWNRGIGQAVEKGFITPPVGNGIPLDGDSGNGNGTVSSGSKSSGSVMGASSAGPVVAVQKGGAGGRQSSLGFGLLGLGWACVCGLLIL